MQALYYLWAPMSNILELFQPIKAFVFDVDGVLTDGGVWVLEDGQQVRKMSTRDGYALQLAVKKGYSVCVISGGIPPLCVLGYTN